MMKQAFAAILVFFCLGVQTGFACELTVRVPEGNTYAPYFIQDSRGKWSGLAIEFVEALLQEAGCSPIYMPLPFARSLEYLQEGKLQLMLNMTVTEERKAYAYFVGPQIDETVVLVVPRDSRFKITSLESLKDLPKPVGVERGKVYGREFEAKRATDKAFQIKLDEVAEVDFNEKKLAAGRISCFFGYRYNVLYRLKTDPIYKHFAMHPFEVNQDWVHMGVSKRAVSEGQLKRLQEAYRRASQKGVFEAVRRCYAQP